MIILGVMRSYLDKKGKVSPESIIGDHLQSSGPPPGVHVDPSDHKV